MKLVLASSNPGKLAEFTQILAEIQPDWELLPQTRFNITPAEETGLSFIENALLKARHAAQMTGLPALADDSGLCVDALDGAAGRHGEVHRSCELPSYFIKRPTVLHGRWDR